MLAFLLKSFNARAADAGSNGATAVEGPPICGGGSGEYGGGGGIADADDGGGGGGGGKRFILLSGKYSINISLNFLLLFVGVVIEFSNSIIKSL